MKRFLYSQFRIFYSVSEWMRIRFTRPGFLILSATTASAILGIDIRRAMAYQCFSLLAGLMAVSMLISLFFRFRWKIRRILPAFATAGVPFSYRVVIEPQGKTPVNGLWIREMTADPRPDYETFLGTPEPDESTRNLWDRMIGYYRWQWLIGMNQIVRTESRRLPALYPGRSETVSLTLVPLRRGVLEFTGTAVLMPDPMGLFNAVEVTTAPQSLVVLPRRYPLPPVRLPGTRQYHSGGISFTSSVGDSEEFVSLRDYRPGDPLKKIHWKSLARTGKPVVKEFLGEYFVRHALILDTFQETSFGESFEEAVSVAASFVCALQTQESLLDLIFVGSRAYCFTSGRGLGAPDRILSVLASVKPCTDKPFCALIPPVMERASIMSACICILLRWDEERKAFIRRLVGMNAPVMVLVISDSDPDLTPEILGPMASAPDRFHILRTGRIREGLAAI